jgi:hypothetical protein
MFEARWNTVETRMAGILRVGYGQMWLPPPTRAGSSLPAEGVLMQIIATRCG